MHIATLLRFFCVCFLGCFNDTMDFDYKGWVDQWMFRRKTMLEVPMRARPTTYVFSMYTEMYKTNTNYIMTRHSQKVHMYIIALTKMCYLPT